MIPLDEEGEELLIAVEDLLLDLRTKYNAAPLTRATLMSMQFDLNDIVKALLPIPVEDEGKLYELVGFTLRFNDEKKLTIIAKLQDEPIHLVEYFSRRRKKG